MSSPGTSSNAAQPSNSAPSQSAASIPQGSTDTPWTGDACSLVEAFRSGERSPAEELEATLAAIEASDLNCFSFLDPEQAREKAVAADVSLPFGGVPFGVKELDCYLGWPDRQASLAFADNIASVTGTALKRAETLGGVVPVGLTTASEFGGLNVSITKINGITHNPWQHGKTAGGSSGGSAAAVAGGLVTIASGGDGGGSIRIPAAFNGLPGLKSTAGLIPRGPDHSIHPMTVVTGVMARSVRDIARHLDVTSGYDPHDPYSLPKRADWERNLGSYGDSLTGKRVVVVPDLGSAIVNPAVADLVRHHASELIAQAGLREVEVDVTMPSLGFEWALANLCHLRHELGDRWPECKDLLTTEIAFGLEIADQVFNLSVMGSAEAARTRANSALADLFGEVDFIISATNPDVAFPAELGLNTRVADQPVGAENNGALTIPYNIVGNPSVTIPVGLVDGLPVGMQVATRHHCDELLLDLALMAERERPWPLVAPGR